MDDLLIYEHAVYKHYVTIFKKLKIDKFNEYTVKKNKVHILQLLF